MEKLLLHTITIQNKISSAERDRDLCWDYFHKIGGNDNHIKLIEAENRLKYWQDQYADCEKKYNEFKNKTVTTGKLNYAITIGSAETDNTTPCESLWNRFINSADGKKCYDVKAFFEKGTNGFIHIHAIVTRDQKWSMSINKLQQRYGKYKGKQHNFFLKRITGLDITKWENYIMKDSSQEWNKKANEFFLS